MQKTERPHIRWCHGTYTCLKEAEHYYHMNSHWAKVYGFCPKHGPNFATAHESLSNSSAQEHLGDKLSDEEVEILLVHEE